MNINEQLREFERLAKEAFGHDYFPPSETRLYFKEPEHWLTNPYDSPYLNGAWNFYARLSSKGLIIHSKPL
jgi:hypothetical protein